jgi:hypothetical protein
MVPKQKKSLVHTRHADTPRNHYYVGRCDDCAWTIGPERAPLKTQKEAKTHAKRATGHVATVVDVTDLETISTYRFDALPDIGEDAGNIPPF